MHDDFALRPCVELVAKKVTAKGIAPSRYAPGAGKRGTYRMTAGNHKSTLSDRILVGATAGQPVGTLGEKERGCYPPQPKKRQRGWGGRPPAVASCTPAGKTGESTYPLPVTTAIRH